MSEPLVPDTVLSGPLPWFLQEPSTHPEAAPLCIAACEVLRRVSPEGALEAICGSLTIKTWWKTSGCKPGLGIWYQEHVVLLADECGTVWLWHPGAAWQTAWYALVPQHGDLSISSQSFGTSAAGIIEVQSDPTSPHLSTPVWTGNPVVPGHLPLRQRATALQDIIDESTLAFQQRRKGIV